MTSFIPGRGALLDYFGGSASSPGCEKWTSSELLGTEDAMFLPDANKRVSVA